MATTKFEKPVGSETFQLQQQVSTINTSLNALTTKVGNVGSTDLQTQVNTLNSKLETGNNFDFTLSSNQTSRFAIHAMRARTFGGIYIFCLMLKPLVDIGTGEISLGDVSVAPGCNTASVVTRNSDTKPIGGANLLENKRLYINLTESVNQGNYIYVSIATTTYK